MAKCQSIELLDQVGGFGVPARRFSLHFSLYTTRKYNYKLQKAKEKRVRNIPYFDKEGDIRKFKGCY